MPKTNCVQIQCIFEQEITFSGRTQLYTKNLNGKTTFLDPG